MLRLRRQRIPGSRRGQIDPEWRQGGAGGGDRLPGGGDDQVPILDDEAPPEPGDEAAEELVVGLRGLEPGGEDAAAHRRGDGGVKAGPGGDGLGDRGEGLTTTTIGAFPRRSTT